VQIQNFGGINELRGFLKALKLVPEFDLTVQSVALVRDAEANAITAQQAARDALKDAGFPVPSQPLIQTGGPPRPRVSFLVLPGGLNNGKLETMCLSSVSVDPAMPCVDSYFQCLHRAGLALPSNMDKARLQAFLASRPEPGMLLGQAAHAGYWPWPHPAFDQIKQLVQAL